MLSSYPLIFILYHEKTPRGVYFSVFLSIFVLVMSALPYLFCIYIA